MFAGAIAACRKTDGTPFYFETRDHTLVFLDDFSTMQMRAIDDVEVFYRVNGFKVSRRGLWSDEPIRQQRLQITRELWKLRGKLRNIYEELDLDKLTNPVRIVPFFAKADDVVASLDKHCRANLQIGSRVFTIPKCPDFAKYLRGGWLEEYTYSLLEPALAQGSILDLRIGLEVAWPTDDDDGRVFPAQEFDVPFTDGKRLWIVECKAGRVTNEDFYRLQNSVRTYGGVESRGTLVAALTIGKPVQKRFEDTLNLSWVYGDAVPEELQAIGKVLDV